MTGVDKLQMIMCDVNVVAFTDKLIQPCSLPQLVSLCPQLFGQLRTVNCSGAHWWEKTMWLAFQLSHYCPRRKKINKDRERILNLLLKHPWLRFGVSPFSTSPSSAGPITNFYLTYSTLKVTTLVRWVSKTLLYHNSGFIQLPSSLLFSFMNDEHRLMPPGGMRSYYLSHTHKTYELFEIACCLWGVFKCS